MTLSDHLKDPRLEFSVRLKGEHSLPVTSKKDV